MGAINHNFKSELVIIHGNLKAQGYASHQWVRTESKPLSTPMLAWTSSFAPTKQRPFTHSPRNA